jgi:hypothetical protein
METLLVGSSESIQITDPMNLMSKFFRILIPSLLTIVYHLKDLPKLR